MSFSIRLKEIRMNLGLTQKAMAEKIGYKKGHYSMIETGKQKPGRAFIESLVSTFNLSRDYLFTGVGNIYTNVKIPVEKYNHTEATTHTVQEPRIKLSSIPLIEDQKAYCGALVEYQGTTLEKHLSMLPCIKLPTYRNNNALAFIAYGESMLPTIAPNDILISEPIEPDTVISFKNIYVVVHCRDGIVVKRVIDYRTQNGTYELHSDNVNYAPIYSVPAADVQQIFRVRYKITDKLSVDSDTRAELQEEIKLLKKTIAKLVN